MEATDRTAAGPAKADAFRATAFAAAPFTAWRRTGDGLPSEYGSV